MPGQESFVSYHIRSLAQACVYRDQCQPFGIYAAGRMVGNVTVIYDYDVPELYESRGFSATGVEDEDEIELDITMA